MKTLADYFFFVKERPELFRNPPQCAFTILLKEEEIMQTEAAMAQRLQEHGLPVEWARVGIVFEDRYGYIFRDAVRFRNGELGTYIRFVSRDDATSGVVVLPLYQGKVLLLRRFRHATRNWHFEIPLGPGAKGLSSESSAREQLLKDIGAEPSRLVALGQIDTGPGPATGNGELFYAEVETYGRVNTHEGITELLCLSITRFEQMIRDNQITDSFTIAAYIRAKVRGLLETNS